MTKPLHDLRIVELTHVIAAPFCGMLLGDIGAEIIKIEPPGTGEYGRFGGVRTSNGTALWFPNYNRNKMSLSLDLKSKKGKDLFLDLIRKSDILIENFRPGLLGKMGFAYEDLKKVNPGLIMASISGFGQNSPQSYKTAFDMNVMAESGMMSITGEEQGVPMKMGTAISDFLAGIYGALGILAAVRHRDQTGEGQYVDVSMLASLVSVLETNIAEWTVMGLKDNRPGNRRPASAPSNVFMTKTGYIYIAAFFERYWKSLAKAIGREDFLQDPGLKTGQQRKVREREIEDAINAWIKDKTADEAIAILEKDDIPCAYVNGIDQMVSKYRELLLSFDYPGIGEFTTSKFPVKFSTIDTSLDHRAPLLGEHNEKIICEILGRTTDEYKSLVDDRVI
jgi:CoA:oxalate CoA-transferase